VFLLEAGDRGHRTLVWLIDFSRTKFSGIAMARFLTDTRGFTDMTVPDESDRASTVKVDSFDSAKLDEKRSKCLEIETLLLGFNTVNNDKEKMTILIPADGETRSKELDEALGNVLLFSRSLDVALAVADEPSTALNELLEAGLLDETLIGVTSEILAVMGDTEGNSASRVFRVEGLSIADDITNASALLHIEEASVCGNLALVLLRGGRSGSDARAFVTWIIDVEGLSGTLDDKSMTSDGLTNKRLLQNLMSNNLEFTRSRSASSIIAGKVSNRRLSAHKTASHNGLVERLERNIRGANKHADSS